MKKYYKIKLDINNMDIYVSDGLCPKDLELNESHSMKSDLINIRYLEIYTFNENDIDSCKLKLLDKAISLHERSIEKLTNNLKYLNDLKNNY